MAIPTSFSSKAWLLDGPVHSLPGILDLDSGCLNYLILGQGTFSTTRLIGLLEANGAAKNATPNTFPVALFSAPVETISRFVIPWYSFGAGGRLEIDNRSFRFSFVKPQNTVEPTYYSEAFMEWRGGEGQEEVNIAEGKSAGKMWKHCLSA